MPEPLLSSTPSQLKTAYSYRLSFKEVICDPLLGRLKRESDRKAFSVICVDRVCAARELSRNAAGKRLSVGQDVALHFNATGLAKVPRNLDANYLVMQLLEVLWLRVGPCGLLH